MQAAFPEDWRLKEGQARRGHLCLSWIYDTVDALLVGYTVCDIQLYDTGDMIEKYNISRISIYLA